MKHFPEILMLKLAMLYTGILFYFIGDFADSGKERWVLLLTSSKKVIGADKSLAGRHINIDKEKC